jgi:hypothetical protein
LVVAGNGALVGGVVVVVVVDTTNHHLALSQVSEHVSVGKNKLNAFFIVVRLSVKPRLRNCIYYL